MHRSTEPPADLSRWQAANPVLLALHRAGQEVALARFQHVALDLLRELIPFDSAWWGLATANPGEILQLHLCQCDPAILQAYAPCMQEDFMRAALLAQPGQTINLSDLTSHRDYVRTRLYRLVGQPFHVEWSLGTVQVEPHSELQEFLTIWRHDRRRPFTEAERQTKQLLMPHMVQAHRMARLREMLDGVAIGSAPWAIVDGAGHLRDLGAGFVHGLRRQWPGWTDTRLPQPLREALGHSESYRTAHWRLRVAPRGALQFLQLTPLGAADRLGARQRDVAQRFARGDSHGTIAKALGLAPATVRNHLAHCYRKLGVSNKAELVLRLMQDGNWPP